jgi:phosphate-selective porin OprO/OprP
MALSLLTLSNLRLNAQDDLLDRISKAPDSPYSADFSEDEAEADSAAAGSPADSDPTDERIAALEAQVQSLRQMISKDNQASGRLAAADIAAPKDKKEKVEKTYPNVRVTGFFQADAGWIQQDSEGRAQFGDINDSQGFRRARLAAAGDVAKNVSYIIEMDFALAGRPTFFDVWADFHDVKLLGNVRVGYWRQPFGMDSLTSVRELTFLERALPFAFVPFRQIGVGFHDGNEDQTVTWAGSAFGFPTDQFGDHIGDGGYGAAGRVTALPWYENAGRELVHVGFNYCYEDPSAGGLRYRSAPEFGGPFGGPTGTISDIPAFVDTGVLANSTANLFDLELAAVAGSFHTQAEMTFAAVNLPNAGTVTFPGFYTQAAYILTGEVRPYNKVAGVLGRIKPDRPWGSDGWGALEIAGRYSYLDLNQGGIGGGRMSNYTVGLNWYINNNTKFQFNYIVSDLDKAASHNAMTHLYAMRCQLDF